MALPSLFGEVTSTHSDRVAVSDVTGRQLTYEELNRASTRVAFALRDRGVETGDYVGLMLSRTVDVVIGILGVLKAGAAYVSLENSPRERAAGMLRDAGVRCVLADDAHEAELLVDTGATRLDIAGCTTESLDPAAVLPEIHPDQPAYLIYTSGSTGSPKGVLVTHRTVDRLFRATEAGLVQAGGRLDALSLDRVRLLRLGDLGALLYGGRLVVVPRGGAGPRGGSEAAGRGVTVLNQTPSAFRALIDADESAGLDLRARARSSSAGKRSTFAMLRRGSPARRRGRRARQHVRDHGDDRPRDLSAGQRRPK